MAFILIHFQSQSLEYFFSYSVNIPMKVSFCQIEIFSYIFWRFPGNLPVSSKETVNRWLWRFPGHLPWKSSQMTLICVLCKNSCRLRQIVSHLYLNWVNGLFYTKNSSLWRQNITSTKNIYDYCQLQGIDIATKSQISTPCYENVK